VLEDENYRFGKVESGVLRFVLERLFFGTAEMNSPSSISGDIVCPHGEVLLGETGIYWDCPQEPKNKIYVLTITRLRQNPKLAPELAGVFTGNTPS
jgi:hypothetical protein